MPSRKQPAWGTKLVGTLGPPLPTRANTRAWKVVAGIQKWAKYVPKALGRLVEAKTKLASTTIELLAVVVVSWRWTASCRLSLPPVAETSKYLFLTIESLGLAVPLCLIHRAGDPELLMIGPSG